MRQILRHIVVLFSILIDSVLSSQSTPIPDVSQTQDKKGNELAEHAEKVLQSMFDDYPQPAYLERAIWPLMRNYQQLRAELRSLMRSYGYLTYNIY
jgi:hypothetical protein